MPAPLLGALVAAGCLRTADLRHKPPVMIRVLLMSTFPTDSLDRQPTRSTQTLRRGIGQRSLGATLEDHCTLALCNFDGK